ncbi:MAG: hypothetical protein K2X82_02695 [Gemmataceae bacterium]|nr:hypothetical protein [Gemmataceae bacterium]
MPKASKAEVAARVDAVLRIRLDGAQFHDIVQYAAAHGWGVEERQLWNYVRKAGELLVERGERSRRRAVALHLARRDALYARAVEAADYRTALAVLADAAKLQGLYVSDRELKEVARLAAAQAARVRELEARLDGRPAEAAAVGDGPGDRPPDEGRDGGPG